MSVDPCCGRKYCRMVYQRRHEDICTDEEAAAVTSGLAVSCCMDNIVFAHGAVMLPDYTSGRKTKRKRAGAVLLRTAAGSKCFVAGLVLSVSLVFVCISVAASAVDLSCSCCMEILSSG